MVTIIRRRESRVIDPLQPFKAASNANPAGTFLNLTGSLRLSVVQTPWHRTTVGSGVPGVACGARRDGDARRPRDTFGKHHIRTRKTSETTNVRMVWLNKPGQVEAAAVAATR
jgi:hypothetical protein